MTSSLKVKHNASYIHWSVAIIIFSQSNRTNQDHVTYNYVYEIPLKFSSYLSLSLLLYRILNLYFLINVSSCVMITLGKILLPTRIGKVLNSCFFKQCKGKKISHILYIIYFWTDSSQVLLQNQYKVSTECM